jgi:hypothetical protein
MLFQLALQIAALTAVDPHANTRGSALLCLCALQAFYEAVNNGPVNVVPLAPYVSDVQCPYPKPPNGDMTLPSWIYNPGSGKCYYKSSFAKGISGNVDDATRRCAVRSCCQLLDLSQARSLSARQG